MCVACSRLFIRWCSPWPLQADMRGRRLSAPQEHLAPGHKMRERAVREHADRQVD